MPELHLTVITPFKTLIDNRKIRSMKVKLAGDYPLSILPNHAPLVAELGPSDAKYIQDGRERVISIEKGTIRILNNQIICAIEGRKKPEIFKSE